jgi:hypothetical protein
MILDNKTPILGNFSATEISVKKQVKVEPDYLLEGQIIPKKGQLVYEIEIASMQIKEAEYERTTVALFGAEIPPRKLIMREGCIYIPAINKNNALRKFKKDVNQRSYLTVSVSQLSDIKIKP